MVTKKLRISNSLGLHGRAAAKLAETAGRFRADIRLLRDGEEVDCKSILDVMSMACVQGTTVTIRAAGDDAVEALRAVEELFNSKFGED